MTAEQQQLDNVSEALLKDLELMTDVVLTLARHGDDIEKVLAKKMKLKTESEVASLHNAVSGTFTMILVLARALELEKDVRDALAAVLEADVEPESDEDGQ